MVHEHTKKRPCRPLGGLLFLAIAGVFLTTGACGLIYQVAWQRYLLNLFGATIYSISTVLAAFMGGLALGSLLFGRVAEKIKKPLRLYGILEIIVGVSALLVPTALRSLDPLFVSIYGTWGSQFFVYSLLRFVLIFAILLVPTTMMGGTLPLLSKFVSPSGKRPGARVGTLYAMNTFGAVTGTILTGFFLLRVWGVSNTIALAVALNIAAGIIAILLARMTTSLPDGEDQQLSPASSTVIALEPPSPHARLRPLVFLAYFVSGFAALGLEVVWSRSLVFTFELLKNTTYSFSAMLAVFLVGIAVGSSVASPIVERDRSPWRTFALLQILIGLSATISFFVLYGICYELGASWVELVDAETGAVRWTQTLALVFLRSAAVVFPPTFLMGFAFPYAVRCVTLTADNARVGEQTGQLYSINTLGAILGSFLTGFFILPALGIAQTIWLLGAIQAATGILLFTGVPSLAPASKRLIWVTLGALGIAVTFLRIPRPAVFQPLEPLEKLLFYKEGPLATVAVTENSLGYRTIFVDNVGVAGTEPMLLTDQKSLAHVPMLFLRNPKRALTVGFGSGGASYSYTLHPELEDIHCVEITETVIEAAPTLVDSNHDVVTYAPEYKRRTGRLPAGNPLWDDGGRSGWYKSDPRYRIILDDVRSYLHFTNTRYDIIATDCTDLRYKSNANLYDYEYFRLTRDRITDDGMVVVWMPLAGLSDEAFRVALRTFYRVFPNMEIFYMNNEPTHYLLLIGTKEPLKVDLGVMRAKLGNERVRKDLAELHLDSAEKILSCFICGRDVLKDYLSGDILNTEDFPYLEFESPRFGYGDAPILHNLESLVKLREHPARLLTRANVNSDDLALIQRYFDAAPHIIEGHHHYRKVELLEAAKSWLKALEINPNDQAVRNLLRFEELRRKVAGQPDNVWAALMMGEVLLIQDKAAEATPYFKEAIKRAEARASDPRIATMCAKAWQQLAQIAESRGRKEEAQKYREQAVQLEARQQ